MVRPRCISCGVAFLMLLVTAVQAQETPSEKPTKKNPRSYRLRLSPENIQVFRSVHPAVARKHGSDAKQVRSVVFLQENGKLQRVTGDATPLPRPIDKASEQVDSNAILLTTPKPNELDPEFSSRKPKPAATESEASLPDQESEPTEPTSSEDALALEALEALAADAKALNGEAMPPTGSMVQDTLPDALDPTDLPELSAGNLELPEDPSEKKEASASEPNTESESKPTSTAELDPEMEAEFQQLFGDTDERPAPEVPLSAKLASGPTDLPVDPEATSEDSAECPGAPDGQALTLEKQPEDIPLDQEEHPYDAPKTKSIEDNDALVDAQATFSPRELQIHDEINQTLAYFLNNPETVVRRGPWALMHAALPFGVETEVIAGKRRVNALGWMCYNGVCARQRMFQPTRSGFRTNVGPGVQGHEGQFLAILAQSRVNPEYPLKIGNRTYSIHDLVRYEMATCREKSELTFKLIGLSYYLQPDMTWRDNRGGSWNLEKLIVEEMAQSINGQACGGTHRLMGLSYALIERQRKGQPIEGAWSRAEQYLNDYVNYTMTLQNPDGSFSTNWFESRGNDPDVKRKVQTTGHMLEWLIFTLPDEHLRSQRIQLSMEYLLKTVGKNPGYDWPIGPRGHALRAMALYNQRLFGAQPGQMKSYIADQGGIRIR